MKRNVICMMILMGMSMESHAQQIDPALTGAVAAQSVMLNQLFSKREKTQQKIIAAEAAVTVAMDRMHKVEDQMLDYLSNAQGAMQNLYQIKRAAFRRKRASSSGERRIQRRFVFCSIMGFFL